MPVCVRVLPLAVVALALAACGEDRYAGGEDPGAAGRDAPALEIVATDYALEPARPRIARAGPITALLVNEGDTDHALVIEGPRGERMSRIVTPGERTRLRMDLPPGTYKFSCPIDDHAARGMTGRLRIGSG